MKLKNRITIGCKALEKSSDIKKCTKAEMRAYNLKYYNECQQLVQKMKINKLGYSQTWKFT